MDSRFSKGWSSGLNCRLRMPLGKISLQSSILAQFPSFQSSWRQEDSRGGILSHILEGIRKVIIEWVEWREILLGIARVVLFGWEMLVSNLTDLCINTSWRLSSAVMNKNTKFFLLNSIFSLSPILFLLFSPLFFLFSSHLTLYYSHYSKFHCDLWRRPVEKIRTKLLERQVIPLFGQVLTASDQSYPKP